MPVPTPKEMIQLGTDMAQGAKDLKAAVDKLQPLLDVMGKAASTMSQAVVQYGELRAEIDRHGGIEGAVKYILKQEASGEGVTGQAGRIIGDLDISALNKYMPMLVSVMKELSDVTKINLGELRKQAGTAGGTPAGRRLALVAGGAASLGGLKLLGDALPGLGEGIKATMGNIRETTKEVALLNRQSGLLFDTYEDKNRFLNRFNAATKETAHASPAARKSAKELGLTLDTLGILTEDVVKGFSSMRGESVFIRRFFDLTTEKGAAAAGEFSALAKVLEKSTNLSLTQTAQALQTLRFRFKDATPAQLVKQFKTLTKSVHGVAQATGVDLGTAMQNYIEQSKTLVPLGTETQRNFTELYYVAEKLGWKIQDLTTLGTKFDTYETAGQQIGQLSAILGGVDLSVGQLLTADPAEKVRLVLGEIQKAEREGRIQIAEGGELRRKQMEMYSKSLGVTGEQMDLFFRGQLDIDKTFAEAKAIKGQENHLKKIQETARATTHIGEQAASVQATLSNRITTSKDILSGLEGTSIETFKAIRSNIRATTVELGTYIAKLEAARAVQSTIVGVPGAMLFGQAETVKQLEEFGVSTLETAQDVLKRTADLATQLHDNMPAWVKTGATAGIVEGFKQAGLGVGIGGKIMTEILTAIRE